MIFQVNMLLYKPSDQSSSNPVEFWYVSDPSTNALGPPALVFNQQKHERPFKTPLKRPKERATVEEQSTGI